MRSRNQKRLHVPWVPVQAREEPVQILIRQAHRISHEGLCHTTREMQQSGI